MNLYFIGIFVVGVLGSNAVSYVVGSNAATTTEQARCAERERVRMTAIEAERLEQEKRVRALDLEFEKLRAKPERIRTITKTITVKADEQCESLPTDWRVLWSSGSVPVGAVSDKGATATGPRVGNAEVSAVADDTGKRAGKH